ncbi:hypothetical protein NKH57_02525 [Mesorhizobium sp. M1050]|uniref:hypothetical protein n=1 Tax=Mesorhizobium sp. M1050 TaxID=2957051 RepID=UPI0033396EA5
MNFLGAIAERSPSPGGGIKYLKNSNYGSFVFRVDLFCGFWGILYQIHISRHFPLICLRFAGNMKAQNKNEMRAK